MGLQIQPNGSRTMETDEAYRNYPKAIACFEKILDRNEKEEKRLMAQNQAKLPKGNGLGPAFGNLIGLANTWNKLYFLYKASGDSVKTQVYWQKMFQRASREENPLGDLFIAWTLLKVFSWNEDFDAIKGGIELCQKALVKREIEIQQATEKDKPLLALKYREQLKGLGAMYLGLKNYTEAEKFFLAAIDYPIPATPITQHLKQTSGSAYWQPNRY